MNNDTALLRETVDKIFTDWGSGSDAWSVVEDTGLTRIGIDEHLGGSGGTAADAEIVLHGAAYHNVAAPIAETLWLAAPLLAAARLPIPVGPLTAVTADQNNLRLTSTSDGNWVLDGLLRRVPWARSAVLIVVVLGDRVCLLDRSRCAIQHGTNLAGEPRDEVRLDRVVLNANEVVPLPGTFDLDQRAVLARSIQIGGAAQRAVDLSVRYARERVQFGRPIGAFQAMQQYLAQIAGEASIIALSARSAVRITVDGGDAAAAVAAARISACRSAGVVAELAHQVHGAIGTTEEHELHLSTLRLGSWREEFGNEYAWARALGGRVAAADDPWVFLTSIDQPHPR